MMPKSSKIKTSAPGKVILFGEHAVVYGKLGIATSIDRRCSISAERNEEKSILIKSPKINIQKKMDKNEIFELFNEIETLKEKGNFEKIRKINEKNKLMTSFFLVSNIMNKYGFEPIKILINSNVPKGLGSSSSLFSAISLATSKFLGKELSKKEISELTYEGDVIAHGGTPSGIDNTIVTYGGFIKYSKCEGMKRLKVNFHPPLIFVESGEEARTSETVAIVRNKREKNRKFVDEILERLDLISHQALEAIKTEDFRLIGNLMVRYYLELKKLGISTKKLDKIINIALKFGAFGAKPTGGWGGGCCVILAKDESHTKNLIETYRKFGFNSFYVKVGVEGVRYES